MNLNKPQINSLISAILALKDEKEAKYFLRDLLTESEIEEFSKRWQAAQMLDKKMPYTEIVKQTGLSSTTVARVANWLKNGKGGYRLMLNKLHHHNSISRRKSCVKYA